jgi:hypothetical protein
MSNNGYRGRNNGGWTGGVRTITQEYGNNVDADTNIPENELLLWLDAGNPLSYPGSGSIWYDLAPGRPYNMTMYNSPTWSPNNGGIFQFNGTNQYGLTSLNMASGVGSVVTATRYSGATRGRILSSESNNWLLGHHSSSVTEYYAEGWIQDTAVNDTAWRIYVGSHNTVIDWYSFWINGVNVVSNSTAGSAGPNNLCVGRTGLSGGSEYSTGECGFILAYSRVLTNAEITQIFNIYRKRYGL